MKRTLRLLLLSLCLPVGIWAQTGSMDVRHTKDAKGNDELIFELFIANPRDNAFQSAEVAFSMPPGTPDQIVQVLEKSIKGGIFMVESRSSGDARTLKFKAKNIDLSQASAGEPGILGKIKIKTNLPFDKWSEIKATLKFDDKEPENFAVREVSN